MPSITIKFGIALIILGIGGYVATGMVSPTALIPALFGVLLLIVGLVARDEHKRKHAMHFASIIALLGFLGSVNGLFQLPALLGEASVERPGAVISKALMAVLTGIYFALCVKSFVDARRRRLAQGG